MGRLFVSLSWRGHHVPNVDKSSFQKLHGSFQLIHGFLLLEYNLVELRDHVFLIRDFCFDVHQSLVVHKEAFRMLRVRFFLPEPEPFVQFEPCDAGNSNGGTDSGFGKPDPVETKQIEKDRDIQDQPQEERRTTNHPFDIGVRGEKNMEDVS